THLFSTHASMSAYCFYISHDTPTTGIVSLSLHDALPIFCRFDCVREAREVLPCLVEAEHLDIQCTKRSDERKRKVRLSGTGKTQDRKSTRLNSSNDQNSYAVFCFIKKNNNHKVQTTESD